jgi:nucleoside-diphosphate-sugar epimerase
LLTINYLRSSPIRFTIFRPHNVYGPQMGHEHVIPQLTRRIVEALQSDPQSRRVSIQLQGRGDETRAFMYVQDFVRALEIATLQSAENALIHIGVEQESRIIDLAVGIGRVLGVDVKVQAGSLTQGSPLRRCPDTTRLRELGFVPEFTLERGLEQTVPWYAAHYSRLEPAAVQ